MAIYELFLIFIVGAALGVIARYIIGYRKKHVGYVALNIVVGCIASAVSYFLGGIDYYAIFLSGAGGVALNFLYSAGYLIYLAI